MKKNLITNYLNSFLKFSEQNAPTILTGLGVLGVFETARLAYIAGSKGKKIMEEKRKDLEDVRPGDKDAKRAVVGEIVKEMAPVVAPPVIMGGVTTACIIGSNRVSSKRMAALSAAYSLTETALKDYKQKTEELIGRKKAMEIRESLARDAVKDAPILKDESKIVMTGDGNVLCMDSYTKVIFYSNAQKIESVINKLSRECLDFGTVTLNDFRIEIGLNQIPIGDDLGWGLDDLNKGCLPVYVTATLTDEGRPCLYVDYDVHYIKFK